MAGFPVPDPNDPQPPPMPARALLGYLAPAYVGRPAPVAAAGGIGIVVGILGIVTSLVLLSVAGGLMSVSASTEARVKQFAPQALPVSRADQPAMIAITPAPAESGPHGLAGVERDALMPLLGRQVALSAGQQRQLDALLRVAGRQLFPGTVPVSDSSLAAALVERGIMHSGSANGSAAVFLVTAGGRAQVYDDGAVFYPNDGSATVRTNSGPRLNATGHPILRPADVDALVNLIRQTSGGKLNSAQAEALSRMLSAPDQQLAALNGSPEAPTLGISGAGPQPGGYVLIGFAGGSLLLSPAGQALLKGDPLPGVSFAAGIAMMLMALLGLGMAIWLLILSNRLMKQTLVSARRHRRWAAAKVATSLVAGGAFGWMIGTFAASRPGNESANLTGILAGVALAASGCAFPVLLVVLLKKRSARLYFDGVM